MCGRYGFTKPNTAYERFFVKNRIDLKPRYNAAPSQMMPVITSNGENHIELMKWGLIPNWAKDPKIAYMMINARAETLDKKPSYKEPLVRKRCIIPATHFFEWKQTKEGKIPYLFRLKNADMFAFAGLYDVNDKIEGKEIKTFTIITTEPNSLVEPVHNRMPVILKKTTENIWLDPSVTDPEKLMGLLVPFSAGLMEAYPVFSTVNDPANDTPDVIKGIPTLAQ